MKFEPSEDQQKVMKMVKSKNVIIDAVAGSGKTTTIIFIAKEYSSSKILLMTYNKGLRIETKEKIENLNITNVEVHNYHTFSRDLYGETGNTDNIIINVVKKNKPKMKPFKYDMIIVDEVQDMTILYFKLICKILKDNSKVRICVLGDEYQNIYSFKGSDSRFIKFGETVFNFPKKFEYLSDGRKRDRTERLAFSESYRVTNNAAHFINNYVLYENKLLSKKKGNKIRYLFYSKFSEVCDEIDHYLNKGYKYDDIFIVCPSIKSDNVKSLANATSKKKIPIYVPLNDDEKTNDDVLKNKLVFTTYHQVKGLERPVVLVFNFDNSYFKYFKKDISREICPNEIYVACTRSKCEMTLLHKSENKKLMFLNKNNNNVINDVDIIGGTNNSLNHNIADYKMSQNESELKNDKIKNISLIALTSNVSSKASLKSLMNIKIEVSEIGEKIELMNKIKVKDYYENVSCINDLTIKSLIEYTVKNNCKVLNFYRKNGKNLLGGNYSEIENGEKINSDTWSFLSTLYYSETTGYRFKMDQINNFNWVEYEKLEKISKRVVKLLTDKREKIIFGENILIEDSKNILNNCIFGYVDCCDMDNKNIWMFKYLEQISENDILNLVGCAYLFLSKIITNLEKNLEMKKKEQLKIEKNLKIAKLMDDEIMKIENEITKIENEIISLKSENNGNFNFYILNMQNNQQVKINSTYESYCEFINCLLNDKLKKKDLSNKQFLDKIKRVKKKYYYGNE